MNKFARKMVLSVLTVILTVGALGTTTFAWFTLTNTAVIQSFDANIVAETGIEIALDSGTDPTLFNWVSTLTTEDINAFIGDTFLFDDVTTTDGLTFMNYGNANFTATTSGYLELPIHFRSSSASIIQWSQVSLTSTPETWMTGVNFTSQEGIGGTLRTAGDSFMINAADSMRIAVIGSLVLNPITFPITLTQTVIAFENPASVTNVVLGAGGDLSYLATPLDGLGAAGAHNYYFALNNALVTGSNAVATVPTITALADNVVLNMIAGSGTAAGLDDEFYGTITIRIWLEGWDVNTYNAVLTRRIRTSFTFSGV